MPWDELPSMYRPVDLVSWWNLNGDAIDEVGNNDGIQFGTSPTSNRQDRRGRLWDSMEMTTYRLTHSLVELK